MNPDGPSAQNGLSRVPKQLSKPVIGLTGGIGSGKSAVARLLESFGCAVIDFDRLAHEELEHPDVVAALRGWWGEPVLDEQGRVNRRAVAGIVFDDPVELDRLERLLYPRLWERRDALLAQHGANPNVRGVVLDAPKLYEANLDELCDCVVFVDADADVRARRLATTRSWSESERTRREKLLKPLDVKRASADYVVKNNSDLDSLRSEIERVFSTVLTSFG